MDEENLNKDIPAAPEDDTQIYEATFPFLLGLRCHEGIERKRDIREIIFYLAYNLFSPSCHVLMRKSGMARRARDNE